MKPSTLAPVLLTLFAASGSNLSGSKLGPDFGEGDNPSRDAFKTKADVVKFAEEAVADGAKVIQRQGNAGLDNKCSPPCSIWPACGLLSRQQPGATGLAAVTR
jgi:hypothetical protein